MSCATLELTAPGVEAVHKLLQPPRLEGAGLNLRAGGPHPWAASAPRSAAMGRSATAAAGAAAGALLQVYVSQYVLIWGGGRPRARHHANWPRARIN